MTTRNKKCHGPAIVSLGPPLAQGWPGAKPSMALDVKSQHGLFILYSYDHPWSFIITMVAVGSIQKKLTQETVSVKFLSNRRLALQTALSHLSIIGNSNSFAYQSLKENFMFMLSTLLIRPISAILSRFCFYV